MRVKRGISIPIPNQDYLNISRLAALADEAGFDSVFLCDLARKTDEEIDAITIVFRSQ